MPDSSTQLSRVTTVSKLSQGFTLKHARSIAIDSKGNVYIADTENHRILKLSTIGEISMIAGTGKAGNGSDGGLATSTEINLPTYVAVDSEDNLYISDTSNHCIRKVNSDNTISTIAGSKNEKGFSGDGGTAKNAQLFMPNCITFDSNGNLFFADWGNSRIRKIEKSTGNISTVVGSGQGESSVGDGDLATKAALNDPISITIDNKGNLYVCQKGDDRIRKVDSTTGIITTFVGGNGRGFSGDGDLATKAQLNLPWSVRSDSSGNIYIADAGNHRIRMVDSKGIINTVPLMEISDYDNPSLPTPPTGAQTMDFDHQANLYILEWDNNLVRKIALGNTFSIDVDLPLSVIAVVSPETFKKKKDASEKIESVIAYGNIASKYAPYQNRTGGWQLSIVADPPGKDKGTYISFSIHSKAGADDKVNTCEVLALLQNKDTPSSRSSVENQAKERQVSDTVFIKYTHIITAVKDKGKITLYLDGNEIGQNTYTGIIDVNNTEPLNIGKLLPEPEEKASQGGIVRKLSLWGKALSPTEVINFANCMMNTTINFPLKIDYQVSYNSPKQAGQDFTLQIKGTLSLTSKTGLIYSADFDKTKIFTPKIQDLDNLKLKVGQKLFGNATLSDLGNFIFDVIPDNTVFSVTIKADHPDLNNPQGPHLIAEDKFIYIPDANDGVHYPLFKDAVNEAAQKIIKQANSGQNEITYEYSGIDLQQMKAQIKLENFSNCAGFWNLYGNNPSNGQDLSANKNNVSADQVVQIQTLRTVLPFGVEDQKMDNWCWAACSLSLRKFYDASYQETQCQLVTRVFQNPLVHFLGTGPKKPISNEASVCGNENAYNLPYYATEAAKKLNVYEGWSSPLPLLEIQHNLMDGRPMIATIKWDDGKQHYVIISGQYAEKLQDGTIQENVVINDPWAGISYLPIDKLVTEYQGTGDYVENFLSRPVWV